MILRILKISVTYSVSNFDYINRKVLRHKIRALIITHKIFILNYKITTDHLVMLKEQFSF